MPILHREDGTQFVIQPYRELLTLTNVTLLKKELSVLAQSYGGNTRIFKQANGRYEAIFSRDTGYLLGETVWHQFGRPRDLLYCEALKEEKDQVLVVVVRDSMVYLDTKISASQLVEELAPLQKGEGFFAVYTYGDVPISKAPEAGKFSLSNDRVRSFTRLNSSVLKSLPKLSEFNLLPIELAVAELKLNQRTYMIGGVIAAIIILGAIWLWWPASTENNEPNSFQQYVAALRTPDPAQQLKEFAKQIAFAYGNAPAGWIPTKATYNAGGAQFELHSLGSPTTGLLDWAAERGMRVRITSDGATLSLPSALSGRPEEDQIRNSQRALAAVIDRTMQVLPDKSVRVASTVQHELYGETSITLTLKDTSPEILVLLGRALSGLPITLSACTFTLRSGLLSGTIQLTLLGN